MMTLAREDFKRLVPGMERIEVPELDGVVCIRAISAKARDAYDASIDDGRRRDIENISARLVCLCLCDEEGTLLFPDPIEGAEVIGGWPTPLVERLFHDCRFLNRMDKNAVEEAAKNSAPGPADSSSFA